METFSWLDSLRALTEPCLACLRSSKSDRNDLEDLLVDSGSATTADAETLSLHSNPGALAQRRRRSRFGKNIRLFGLDLFGRRQPIRLPDDDDDDDEAEAEREEGEGGTARQQDSRKRKSRRRQPPPTISSSTLDSDAAPLDSAAIASHAEEEAARAARRAQRRERKERKRAALALALEHAAVLDGVSEFEGFPGSGDQHHHAAASGAVPPYVRSGAKGSYHDEGDEDEDEGEGDFGAGAYARRTPVSSDSGRGSDSRSRTSTSLSGPQSTHSAQAYNHHYISQRPSARPTPPPPPVRRTKKDKSSRSSSSSKRSRSSHSASQSPSIASPVAQNFPDAIAAPAPSPLASVPHTAQQLDGSLNAPTPLHTAGLERLSSGFPSPGLSRGPRNGKRDMGAFWRIEAMLRRLVS